MIFFETMAHSSSNSEGASCKHRGFKTKWEFQIRDGAARDVGSATRFVIIEKQKESRPSGVAISPKWWKKKTSQEKSAGKNVENNMMVVLTAISRS